MSSTWRKKKAVVILQITVVFAKSLVIWRKIKLTTCTSRRKRPENEASKTLLGPTTSTTQGLRLGLVERMSKSVSFTGISCKEY